MRRFAHAPLIAGLLIFGLGRAADPEHRTLTSPETLVQQLGSPDYRTREQATRELWQLGEKARSLLQKANQSVDLEVRQRASEILDRFDWGIYPDTPPQVLKLIRDFRSNDFEKQKVALDGLLEQGDRGLDTVALLLQRDFPPERYGALFSHYNKVARRIVPRAIFENSLDRAERILATSALGGMESGWSDYAMFMRFRGKLPEGIQQLQKAQAKSGPRGQSAEYALIWALHLAGKSGDALQLASKIVEEPGLFQLTTSVREDAGRWKELADELGENASGVALFRLTKAGRDESATKVRNQMVSHGTNTSSEELVQQMAVGLLLNRHIEAGLGLFRQKPWVRGDLLCDLLGLRHEFDEALSKLIKAENGDRQDARGQIAWQFRLGRLQAQLGNVTEADKVFNQLLTSSILRSREQTLIAQLLREEIKANRWEIADAHGAYFLDLLDRADDGIYATPSPFETLFDDHAEAARGWWKILRKRAGKSEDARSTMKRIRAIFDGKATAEAVAEAEKAANAYEELLRRADYPNPVELALLAEARATLFRLTGRWEQAEAQYAAAAKATSEAASHDVDEDNFRQSGPRAWVYGVDERFRTWIDYGDFLMERGRPGDAADKYLEGWKQFADNPILLYLAGRAMIDAGKAAEGERMISVSHWIPLGNARMRGRFLSDLCARGRFQDLQKERDLALKCIWYWESSRGNVWNAVARSSILLKEYDQAANAYERYINFFFRSENWYFVDGSAYATVPMSITFNEARALLAAGKVDAAMAKLAEYRRALPGTIDPATLLVPDLDRMGKRAEADQLFRSLWNRYQKLAQQYPKSAWVHHALAQLSANCVRELDAGLTHAKKAVELVPASRGYMETLAEMHFRLGQREEATKIVKELSKVDFRNRLYRRQLERYASGDIKSPIPSGLES